MAVCGCVAVCVCVRLRCFVLFCFVLFCAVVTDLAKMRNEACKRRNSSNPEKYDETHCGMTPIWVNSKKQTIRNVERRSDATTKTNPGSKPIKTTTDLFGDLFKPW